MRATYKLQKLRQHKRYACSKTNCFLKETVVHKCLFHGQRMFTYWETFQIKLYVCLLSNFSMEKKNKETPHHPPARAFVPNFLFLEGKVHLYSFIVLYENFPIKKSPAPTKFFESSFAID
ncbi:hypothetical protein VNO77_12380 [Canavalia gladiata]|uniref:Uncharacterized protein n=1 Tax=Canavalia gladiata TaxID=3824 RepID=A0AAN9QUD8_CANGL